MFLTVWLKRQEQDVVRMQMMLAAVIDVQARKGAGGTLAAYKRYVDAVFPFAAKTRGDDDKKMIEMMKKETAKGPITFDAVQDPHAPLRSAVRRLRAPDDFMKKIRQNEAARARRRM